MVYSGLCDSVRVKGSLRGCPQSPGLRKTSPLHLRIQKQQEDCAHQSHQFLFPQSVIMNWKGWNEGCFPTPRALTSSSMYCMIPVYSPLSQVPERAQRRRWWSALKEFSVLLGPHETTWAWYQMASDKELSCMDWEISSAKEICVAGAILWLVWRSPAHCEWAVE